MVESAVVRVYATQRPSNLLYPWRKVAPQNVFGSAQQATKDVLEENGIRHERSANFGRDDASTAE
ncbi:hypothetical protein [Thalassoroseus pseudoceratinae]|uniref:hypothetical protein n=1 Tax=Thalassoroseus pseudoceratinae TaxID=2713176 RepID=UPI001420173C|nr:hypothetical protein [Thalassoroseus pseudoceratinae]